MTNVQAIRLSAVLLLASLLFFGCSHHEKKAMMHDMQTDSMKSSEKGEMQQPMEKTMDTMKDTEGKSGSMTQ